MCIQSTFLPLAPNRSVSNVFHKTEMGTEARLPDFTSICLTGAD